MQFIKLSYDMMVKLSSKTNIDSRRKMIIGGCMNRNSNNVCECSQCVPDKKKQTFVKMLKAYLAAKPEEGPIVKVCPVKASADAPLILRPQSKCSSDKSNVKK